MTAHHEGTEAKKWVVVVDRRPERRRVMQRMIEVACPGATAVAPAGNADEAIDLVVRHDATVAMIEVQIPPAEDIETVRRLRAGFGDLRIVVCSFHLDIATKQQMLAAGANACIAKPVSPGELRAILDDGEHIESLNLGKAAEVDSVL